MKKLVAGTTIVIAIIILAIGLTIGRGLTEVEQKGVEAIQIIKNDLKNPASMQLNEIRHITNNEDNTFYLDISGENGFGGTTRTIYVVSDGEYVCSDHWADSTITTYTSKSREIDILLSRAVQKSWADKSQFTILNKDKLIKKIK